MVADRLLNRRSVLGLALALGSAWLPAAQAASVAPVAAENGMVVTAQHLASQVGVDVLKRGGNAVDAAVAVGYALAVVYPAAGNLGGGGFMTIQLADGKKTFLDFRERAPLAATANMYLDAAGNVIKGSTTTGHLAVAVPGSVAGLEAALAKYGTMKRADLIAPAIRLAERASSSTRATPTCSRPRPTHSRSIRRRARSSSSPTAARSSPATASSSATSARRCARFAMQALPASTKARSRKLSSLRARPARASSPSVTSMPTRCASWRRSSATTAATTSCRRRRRARAAWSSARS
jgi:hypothetical protein